MKVPIKTLTDFIFPPRCPLCSSQIESPDPHSLCPSCLSEVTFIGPPFCIKCGIPFASPADESHLCGRCLSGAGAYTMARSLCAFSGSIKASIHAFKYQNKAYLAKALVGLIEKSPLPMRIDPYDRLVPVPLHRNRLRHRGYNQSLLLASEISRRYRVSMDNRLLKRIRDSVPQVELAGPKRERNVKGAFSLAGDPTDNSILLIDDVFTTGATVNECARVLRKGGAKRVDVFTVARTL